ncbi:MAG: DUF6044 family protein [Sulfuricurvum sp.]|nr:DUF6044 family protein [Sulfuricurvum sp.]
MIESLSHFFYHQIVNSPRVLFLFSLTALLIYMFPLYYYGEGAQVQIFDNLDIVFPLYKILISSGLIFAPSETIVPNLMGGLPRLVYGSELNVYLWLFYFFQPFIAFTINETLIHISAFVGMFVLLNRYYVPSHHRYRWLILYSISLMFALLPFYTGAGLSVPSLPLAVYTFLNIRKGISRWHDWLIIILIPFYSSLILVYFFFLLVMSGLFLIDFIRKRKINFPFLLALIVMSLVFVIVEYRLFYDTFFQHLFVSHRKEFSSVQTYTLLETYRSAHQVFLNGTVDMDTRASVVLIPFMLLVLLTTFMKKQLSWYISFTLIGLYFLWCSWPEYVQYITGNKFAIPALAVIVMIRFVQERRYKLFFGAILLQIFFASWYGLWFYKGTGELGNTISILKEFNFARIALLQPVVWFIISAVGMIIISRKIYFAPVLIVGMLLIHIYMAIQVREFSSPNSPFSFRAYFAEDLFSKVKQYIKTDPSTYRVGCIGFEPAIAAYNGLYTIDGYVTMYPLEYKHRFHKIIEKTLVEDKGNNNLFLGWGSKCYLFDGGESSLYFRPNTTIKKITLNFDAYYALGGRYLLSSHRIEQSQLKNLIFMKEFVDEKTFWKIFLYKVNTENGNK